MVVKNDHLRLFSTEGFLDEPFKPTWTIRMDDKQFRKKMRNFSSVIPFDGLLDDETSLTRT